MERSQPQHDYMYRLYLYKSLLLLTWAHVTLTDASRSQFDLPSAPPSALPFKTGTIVCPFFSPKLLCLFSLRNIFHARQSRTSTVSVLHLFFVVVVFKGDSDLSPFVAPSINLFFSFFFTRSTPIMHSLPAAHFSRGTKEQTTSPPAAVLFTLIIFSHKKTKPSSMAWDRSPCADSNGCAKNS